MMPIIHDLCKHFTSISLDWIERERNVVADQLAKTASTDSIKFSPSQPDFFKLSFRL